MERLTFEGNFCDIARCGYPTCPYKDGCSQKQVWERLKQYEDTGLSPEKVSWMKEVVEAAFDNDTSRIERAHNLHVADKEGRVVVLPCKVGDRVYIPDIESKTVANVRVQGISITPKSRVVLHFGGYPVESAWGDRCGIDWFITFEEAEKALAEMEGKKDG